MILQVTYKWVVQQAPRMTFSIWSKMQPPMKMTLKKLYKQLKKVCIRSWFCSRLLWSGSSYEHYLTVGMKGYGLPNGVGAKLCVWIYPHIYSSNFQVGWKFETYATDQCSAANDNAFVYINTAHKSRSVFFIPVLLMTMRPFFMWNCRYETFLHVKLSLWKRQWVCLQQQGSKVNISICLSPCLLSNQHYDNETHLQVKYYYTNNHKIWWKDLII